MKKLFLLAVGMLAFCGSVMAWDNSNWIDSNFWLESPTDVAISDAVFGTASIYTDNWSGYNTACSLSGVITLNNGDTMPTVINTWEIYVLNEGTYTIHESIDMNNCTAILGKWDTVINSSIDLRDAAGDNNMMIYANVKSNFVFDGFKLDGITNHTSRNQFGIEVMQGSSNLTINNIEVYETDYGVVIRTTSNMHINNSKAHDNAVHWFWNHTVTNSKFTHLESYNNMWTNNNNDGGLLLYSSSDSLVEDYVAYGNTQVGLALTYSNRITAKRLNIYKNNRWIKVNYWSNNIIQDSNLYSNNIAGFYNYRGSYISIKNCNFFNNRKGIVLWRYTNNVSNVNLFNNDYGFAMWADQNDLLYNLNIFNNGSAFWFEDNWDNNHLLDLNIYNNNLGFNFSYYWNIVKNAPSNGNKYYGDFNMFDNGYDFRWKETNATYASYELLSSIDTWFVISGYYNSGAYGTTAYDGTDLITLGTWSANGFADGTFNDSNFVGKESLIDVINSKWQSLLDTHTDAKKRWKNDSWESTTQVKLVFGSLIPKQEQSYALNTSGIHIQTWSYYSTLKVWQWPELNYSGSEQEPEAVKYDYIYRDNGFDSWFNFERPVFNKGKKYDVNFKLINTTWAPETKIIETFGKWTVDVEANGQADLDINIVPFGDKLEAWTVQ